MESVFKWFSSVTIPLPVSVQGCRSLSQSLIPLLICTESQVKSHNTLPKLIQRRKFTDSIQSPAVTPGTLPLTGSKDRGNYVSTDPGGSKDRLGNQGQSKNFPNCLPAFPKKENAIQNLSYLRENISRTAVLFHHIRITLPALSQH